MRRTSTKYGWTLKWLQLKLWKKLMLFLKALRTKLGKKANRLHLDPDPADVPFTQASTDKAHQLLDWLATTNLHDGIEKTCVWYKNNRDWVSTLDLQEEKFSKQ